MIEPRLLGRSRPFAFVGADEPPSDAVDIRLGYPGFDSFADMGTAAVRSFTAVVLFDLACTARGTIR